MSLYVKEFKQTKRGVTTTWKAIFSNSRKAEDNENIPVLLCATWIEAHEVLSWMKNTDQAEFERKGMQIIERNLHLKRLAREKSLKASHRETAKRDALRAPQP